MLPLKLPRRKGAPAPALPETRQVSIVGGPGAGKTRFMEEMVRLTGSRAYCLSALSAPFPEREELFRPGSIDLLFSDAVHRQPYLRPDAVSELDKLTYMLFVDEFEHLLEYKEKHSAAKGSVKMKPTRLDKISRLWERVFPGNKIACRNGALMFSTGSGEDFIGVSRLSQSEQAIFYYAAAVLYAMPRAVIFIDIPSLFIHPTALAEVWNSIEELRPDCTFVYNSVDVEFIGSRTQNVCLWVKSYDAEECAWEYEALTDGEMHEDMFVDLIGTRKPVLFIEGDSRRSIDAKLYPLVFTDFTVRALGSCDKVIESTRTFNDLRAMHHLESQGLVDRDRRTDPEVAYLRRKNVMVPEVAEVENIFLLEGVIKAMATVRGKSPDKIFNRVRKAVIEEFKKQYDAQALQHVRHRVKREVECKIDARFTCITAMETHLRSLIKLLEPRRQYNELRQKFQAMLTKQDYAGILRVFNHKPMLAASQVAQHLGYRNRDEYVNGVIATLKEGGENADTLRQAIKDCF